MLSLLLDPRARGAFFAETLAVARTELGAVLPAAEAVHHAVGDVDFLVLDGAPGGAPSADRLRALARLASVHAVFGGDARALDGLIPLAAEPGYTLPDALVFGAKYRGKTHEIATQLALNVALAVHARASDGRAGSTPKRLLDPMAGQGTTLLWAARHGLSADGLEKHAESLDGFQRHLAKQCKLHRIKHKRLEGWLDRKNPEGLGRFVGATFTAADGAPRLRLVRGDTRDVPQFLGGPAYDLVVTDLPYGIQFRGGAQRLTDLIVGAVPGWVDRLAPGGVIAMLFNTYQPARDTLVEALVGAGTEVLPIEAPHRMSESIVRDLVVAVRA